MKYFINNNLLNYSGYDSATIEDCLKYCQDKTILGLDIETQRNCPKNKYNEKIHIPGLDPWLSRICMVQIGDLDNQFVIDARVVDISFLTPILENDSIIKVGHNLNFESRFFMVHLGAQLKNIWDTMICERVLYNGLNISYSLENLAYRYLNASKVNYTPELFDKKETDDFYNVFDDHLDENDADWLDLDFSFKIDKTIRLDFVELGDAPFTQAQLDYATDDIIMPLLIRQEQIKGRVVNNEVYNPVMGFRMENAVVPVLAKIELRGITVNTEGWMELYDKNLKIRNEIKTILDAFVVKNHPKFANQMDLFNPEPTCSIEWESSKQVISLFRYLGFCPKEWSKQTKRVEYTVGAKTLNRMLTNENKENFMFGKYSEEIKSDDNNQSLILTYLIYKKYQLLTTTFGKEWLQNVHPITHKVHTRYKQLLNTGRIASSNPNLSQIPNGKEWRELFIKDNGYKLAAVDFSAQEVRVAGIAHNEPLLQEFFITEHPIFKDDFHCFTASKMYSIMRNDPNLIITKKDKKERNSAKAIIFKILYGGSAYTLAQDLGVSEEEGQQFIDALMEAFPGLKGAFDNAKKNAVKNGWVPICLITGKRYFDPDFEEMNLKTKEYWSHFPQDYSKWRKSDRDEFRKGLYEEKPAIKQLAIDMGKLRSSLERKALNYIIQGTSSGLMKIVLLEVEKHGFGLDEGILLNIYDECVAQFKEERAEWGNQLIMDAMKKSGTFIHDRVPMDSVGEIGDYWIH